MAPVVEVCVFNECQMQIKAENPEVLKQMMKAHVDGVHLDKLVRERQIEINRLEEEMLNSKLQK